MDKTSKWFGPLSGILFVVAIAVGVGISGEIDSEPSDPASSVLADFRENADDIQLGAMFSVVGIGFLLIFLGYLRTKLRDGGAGWAADSFLAGGVVLAGAMTVFIGVQVAGSTAGDWGHTEVAQGALDFIWNGTLIFSPGLLAVGIAAAVASFAYRILPIWLGVFAVLVALGALVPWIGIFIFGVWVLAASIAELISASRPETAADVS
jgi:hypothetical protein